MKKPTLVYQYLMKTQKEQGKLSVCMEGVILENMLSENGGVTRGICKVNAEGMLIDIVENHNIVKCDEGAKVVT